MKFAIINDIHSGPDDSGFKGNVQRKLTYEAERLVKELVEDMNTHEQPEFVINLGDSIEDVNLRDTDIRYFQKTQELLSQLKMPVYYLIGNHDVRTLSEDDIAKMLGYEKMYYSFDKGNYHFIALSFVMTGDHTHNLTDIKAQVPKEQINWLESDLAKTDKPVIVFIHYGLAEDDMKGNFWFQSEPRYGLLDNREAVRMILEGSGKVKAVLSAHQHWNRMKIHNGIPYFVVTSLIENFKNDGTPTEAHTIVNLDEDNITVEVKGNDPAKFEFSFK